MKSRTVSISIKCDPKTVYNFVFDLNNLPKWATTFCQSIKKSGGDWTIKTPQGLVKIRIADLNDWGILDHYLFPQTGDEVFVPMRVVPNGSGSEVIFTVFQSPEMSNQNFVDDMKLVKKDLLSLKEILEKK